MTKYIKCPRCDLNYIDPEKQEYCDVCLAEMQGAKLKFADLDEEEDMEKTVESVTAADVKKAAAGLKKKGVFIIAADRSGGAENGRDA